MSGFSDGAGLPAVFMVPANSTVTVVLSCFFFFKGVLLLQSGVGGKGSGGAYVSGTWSTLSSGWFSWSYLGSPRDLVRHILIDSI